MVLRYFLGGGESYSSNESFANKGSQSNGEESLWISLAVITVVVALILAIYRQVKITSSYKTWEFNDQAAELYIRYVTLKFSQIVPDLIWPNAVKKVIIKGLLIPTFTLTEKSFPPQILILCLRMYLTRTSHPPWLIKKQNTLKWK